MKGFILTELIIVIGLVSVFSSLTLFGFSKFEEYFKVRSAKQEVLTILDRTRNLSLAMYQSDGWSFKTLNDKLVIYKGNNYDTRDETFDEFYDLTSRVSASSTSDIYFAPMTGYSEHSTTTLLISSSTSDIVVDNLGNIK